MKTMLFKDAGHSSIILICNTYIGIMCINILCNIHQYIYNMY